MLGEMPGVGMQSPASNMGLPPKRVPGQPPLTSTLNAPTSQMPWSSAPAAMQPSASPDMAAGNAGAGQPNLSRFIPGSPALSQMNPMGGAGGILGMPGMPNTLPGSSLLGREVSHAPVSPMTQPLKVGGASSLSFGGAFGQDPATAVPMAPMPTGRSIASLRAPRGTNFIRLAFAAVFLLGFFGLVAFLLKDYLPSLTGHEVPDEVAKEDASHLPIPAVASPLSKPATDASSQSALATVPETKTKPIPMTVGFDPQEPVAHKAKPASTGILASSRTTPAASVLPVDSTPSPTAAATLLEVPAKPAMNAESSGAPTTSPANQGQTHVIEEEGVPAAAKPAVEALKKFLAAKTLPERLPYTLGADLMQPLMERYYSRAPDGPVVVDRIQFVRMDPNPELGSGKHCIFSLENKTWDFSVPVMLEEKDGGFKVDWVAFVEFKDRLLEKFFKTYQDGEPCYFHVGIIRHHYFEDGIPNLDHKDAFRVSPAPPNPFNAFAFLDKNSKLADELRDRMPWETHVWAVVGLQWKKLGSQQWVELSSVPQMHWYSLPMTRTDPAPQKALTVEDMPPGISKNGVRGKSSGSSAKNTPPPGIRKSTPDLPSTIKRPMPAGR
jgi:hypothetical protein